MKKSLVWPLLVLAVVVGCWCEAWPGESRVQIVPITPEEVQRILRRAELDKQLRNNFVDCIVGCEGGVVTPYVRKRPDALTRGCRDKCVEDYLWFIKQAYGGERR